MHLEHLAKSVFPEVTNWDGKVACLEKLLKAKSQSSIGVCIHSQTPGWTQDAFKEHSNRAGAQKMLRQSPAVNGKEEDWYPSVSKSATLGARSWARMEIQFVKNVSPLLCSKAVRAGRRKFAQRRLSCQQKLHM